MKNERGLSLVEVTIILMVLSALTAMVAPAARAYVEDGRAVKAKKDVETIGAAINELLRSTGLPCLSENGQNATPCANPGASGNQLVELLTSSANTGNDEPEVATAALSGIAASATSATALNWGGGANEVANARRDTMDSQFVANGGNYAPVTFNGGGGPRAGKGWRGPYLNGPVDLDPWGYAYQASTVFLTVASNAPDGTTEGLRRGGWTSDVVVISAGSNATIQTEFGKVATTAVGDDVVYVVQGATH